MESGFDIEIGPNSKPLEVFNAWMGEAKKLGTIREATAMTVSTIGVSGELHSRVVLCKEWSEDGFVFFTNYQSRKGLDLAANPRTALLFYWDPIFRQVKISGSAQKIAQLESQKYWRSRPRESQLSQYISNQSCPIGSREELESLRQTAEQNFAGKEVPCPAHWGGYLVSPQRIEFWTGRPNRLHDRYEFEKAGLAWTFRRLCP